ncbi:MAG: acetoacetate--CoA ligase [Gammaproteobacteria bacterium]
MNTALWQPSPQRIANANLTKFIAHVNANISTEVNDYSTLYNWSIQQPEAFWLAVWKFCNVIAATDPGIVLVDAHRMPGAQWFPDAKLNFAQNLLHCNDDHHAIIYRDEAGRRISLTYRELNEQVARLADALRKHGIKPGDCVAGFMSNRPETVIAMLAATSVGATWSSCSPDFGVNGVIDRFGQIKPKILFAVDGYYYNGKSIDCSDRIRDIKARLHSVEILVVVSGLSDMPNTVGLDNAVAWPDFLGNSTTHEFAQLPFSHPVYIMYSSGTTGVPKCIVHGAGGTLLQHLKELVLHTDLKREDRIFYFTTCGWMMWNWLVSSLATGATIILHDGSPFHPGPDALFQMAEEEGITIFGTSAKFLSALEKSPCRPRRAFKLDKLHTILSTGSPLLPENSDFVYKEIKADVCLSSISGGTDIVSCFALGNPLLPVYPGELQCRGLGMRVEIFDEKGHSLRGEKGELVCTAPFPSMPVEFWNDNNGEKYRNAYFSRFDNVWCHGDYAELTPHGGLIIYGRSDAVLNPGGVRIGTAEIYRQVEKLDEILESIAVGQEWDDDTRIVLFVRLREDCQLDEKLLGKIRKTIRSNTTPRHVPSKIIAVTDIPRTISGKITELAVTNVIHGRPVANAEALANPEALDLYRDISELAQP